MNLAEKIESIKRKPEHIRLRYIWLCVSLSMFFVIVLWIFSLQAKTVSEKTNGDTIVNLDALGEKIEQEKEALKQINKNIQEGSVKIMSESVQNNSENALEKNIPDPDQLPIEEPQAQSFPVE